MKTFNPEKYTDIEPGDTVEINDRGRSSRAVVIDVIPVGDNAFRLRARKREAFRVLTEFGRELTFSTKTLECLDVDDSKHFFIVGRADVPLSLKEVKRYLA